MQGLFKFCRPAPAGDAISDCAKSILDLHKLKNTYPPETEPMVAIYINLKA